MWHEIARGIKTVKRLYHPCILTCKIKFIIQKKKIKPYTGLEIGTPPLQ